MFPFYILLPFFIFERLTKRLTNVGKNSEMNKEQRFSWLPLSHPGWQVSGVAWTGDGGEGSAATVLNLNTGYRLTIKITMRERLARRWESVKNMSCNRMQEFRW